MFGLTPIYFFLASTVVYAAPVPRDTLDAATLLKNGQAAQNINAQFETLTADSSCNTGDTACIGGDHATCINDKWQTEACPDSLSCFVVPLLTQDGINVTCTSEKNALSTIKATGASGVIALATADQNTSADDDSCDPDTEDGNDDDSGDDTCEPEDGDDDDNGDDGDDTCESEGGDTSVSSGATSTTAPAAASTSASGSKAVKTVTVTAPADSGAATVTVTVTPSASPASVTVSSSTVFTSASTTVLSGPAASSLLSLLSQQGGQIQTTIIGSISATPSSATRSIIELTPPAAATPSAADGASASGSNASRSIIQLTVPVAAATPSVANNYAGADPKPVLTLASPAATTAPAANPFTFSDY